MREIRKIHLTKNSMPTAGQYKKVGRPSRRRKKKALSARKKRKMGGSGGAGLKRGLA